eukprot:scaffold70895_cov17-Tisochrysis_lutea.AAC.1
MSSCAAPAWQKRSGCHSGVRKCTMKQTVAYVTCAALALPVLHCGMGVPGHAVCAWQSSLDVTQVGRCNLQKKAEHANCAAIALRACCPR